MVLQPVEVTGSLRRRGSLLWPIFIEIGKWGTYGVNLKKPTTNPHAVHMIRWK